MDLPNLSEQDLKQGAEIGRWISVQMQKLAKLIGKKNYLLMTRMQGVGKTDLFNHLTGRAFARDYSQPKPSTRSDIGKLNRSMGLTVIPGQTSAPRMKAIQDTLLGKNPPLGIIHVVANGFATTRSELADDLTSGAEKSKTLLSYRQSMLKSEVEDLFQICEWVRQAHRDGRRPVWLMLAVTKCDLFVDDPTASGRYAPGGRGSIPERLMRLTNQVGSDNFSWQAANICSSLVPFNWKSTSIKPQLDITTINVWLRDLINKLLDLSDTPGEIVWPPQ